MNMCRTCLKTSTDNDISELEKSINVDNKNYLDIMLFCLDIQVTQDSKVTTSLCKSCYRKIISFYKFKVRSLKNDAYLKSLDPLVRLVDQKLPVYVDDDEIKHENIFDSDEFGLAEDCNTDIKVEVDVKDEDTIQDVESDEEPLSVVQQIKYEFIENDIKENAEQPFDSAAKTDTRPRRTEAGPERTRQAPKHKKRGRPKKIKLLKAVVKEEKQVCEECGKSVRDLKAHSLQHRPREERRMLQCKACPKAFFSIGGRRRHYLATHLGLKSKCDICNKEVLSLPVHKLQVHNPEAMPHGCVSCERRFLSRGALEFHMRLHTKDLPFECDVCHKLFRSKRSVSIHIRQVHEKEKPHQCHFCSKAFFMKDKLLRHLRSHTNERPYSCEDCGKAFSDKKTLKNHQLIHTGVKSFRCQLCDMTFMRSGYLKSHMISHTKEKRHACQYCGVRFGRSDHRRRHEFTAHQKHLASD